MSGAGVGSLPTRPEVEETQQPISKEQQPYHSGFNSNPNYMHRQHSSINHANMSGAGISGSPPTRTQEEEEERLSYAGGPTRLRRGDWVDV